MTHPTLPAPAPAAPRNKRRGWGCWAILGIAAIWPLVMLVDDLRSGVSASLPIGMLITLAVLALLWAGVMYNPMRKSAVPAPWARVPDPTTLLDDLRTVPGVSGAMSIENVVTAQIDGHRAYLFDAVENDIEEPRFAVRVENSGQQWQTSTNNLPSGDVRTVSPTAPGAVRDALAAQAAYPDDDVTCGNGWVYLKPSFLLASDIDSFLRDEAPKIIRLAAAANRGGAQAEPVWFGPRQPAPGVPQDPSATDAR